MTYEEKCLEHKRLGMAPPMSIKEYKFIITRSQEVISHAESTIRQSKKEIDLCELGIKNIENGTL